MNNSNMNKSGEQGQVFHFTEKGLNLFRQTEEALEEWLEASELTREELLKLRTVEGFHISEDETGICLAYCENRSEKYIGIGLCHEQKNIAICLFGYICVLLDRDSETCGFTKKFLEWRGQ